MRRDAQHVHVQQLSVHKALELLCIDVGDATPEMDYAA